MGLKTFFQVTKGKLFLFILFFAVSSIPRQASNVADAIISYIGFPFPYITMSTSGFGLITSDVSFSIVGLIFNILAIYIATAIIFFIVKKAK